MKQAYISIKISAVSTVFKLLYCLKYKDTKPIGT